MKKYGFKIVIDIFLYLFIFICFLPLIILLLTSFIDLWIYPDILPECYTFDYIKYVIFNNNEPIVKIIFSTMILGFLTSFITIIISIPCSRVLAFYNFKGKFLINFLVILPLIVPSFTIVSISHINLINMSLASNIFGVAITHSVFALPYAIKIIQDMTLEVGKKYEKQGENLGASKLQIIFDIYLPLISPSIILAFFFSFTISISQYLTTLIIGGGKVITLSTVLVPYIQYGKYQIASIYSFILVCITILCYFIINMMEKKLINKSEVK
ncbi:MAG: ABC transporter permease [Lachnospirales bacterium]